MDSTPNLKFPYIVAAQAQKHITHNEAIRSLDAVVQLSVKDRDLTTAPGSPLDGDRYIVGVSATGNWSGKDSQIAAFQDNAWMFYAPQEGWLAWVADEDKLLVWDGSAWAEVSSSTNPTPLVGVNTTASDPNKLAVKSDAVLFSHDDATPGSGDIQTILSKATITNTASFLFQNNWSGRAEIGLVGDDDFRFKVSPDGTNWYDGIVIDKSNGSVTFPNSSIGSGGVGINNNLLINGDFQINQRVFAGGVLGAGVYGHDRWKAAAGGADYSVSGFVITLASGELEQTVETSFWGDDSFASQPFTVSVEDPSDNLTVAFGSQSGVINAGVGRQSLTLTLGAGDTGNLSLKIKRSTSGGVTFGRVKLEFGGGATDWRSRDGNSELVLCSRYYGKSYNADTPAGTITNSGSLTLYNTATTSSVGLAPFLTVMASIPSVTVYNPVTGLISSVRTSSTNKTGTAGILGMRGISAVYGSGYTVGATALFHYVADAEL